LLGLKCQPAVTNSTVVEKLMAAGLLTVAAGDNIVRLVPPLIVEQSHVEEAVGIIDAVSGALAKAA
jgi:acetylornithine/N-succinyldiaminopimelate aminotransferase